MIVVSDTTPLHYLVLIDQVHLLPALFGQVVTTPEVVDEMDQLETPEKVRQWVSKLPEWLEIKEPTNRLPARLA
jgi:predicted nucleic acid-binding protein